MGRFFFFFIKGRFVDSDSDCYILDKFIVFLKEGMSYDYYEEIMIG